MKTATRDARQSFYCLSDIILALLEKMQNTRGYEQIKDNIHQELQELIKIEIQM